MALINIDGMWIPESSIELVACRYAKGQGTQWTVRFSNDRPSVTTSDEPSIRTVIPNTTGVRMLIIWGSLGEDGKFEHWAHEQAIAGWAIDAKIESLTEMCEPITTGMPFSSNTLSCCFDPLTGAHWEDASWNANSRDEALAIMREELEEKLRRDRLCEIATDKPKAAVP